jgi:hypothetical protein
MIGADTVFHVLTEFRFDVGSAIANSKTLQGQVESLSGAADQALFSFQRMSAGIVANMGLGSGGILGMLTAAVQASDKFYTSQLAFSNIIMSNVGHAFTFKQAMAESESIMDTINKKAQEFALPSGEMLQMTKLIGATLMAHGLDSSAMPKSIDLSRQFLKSAPTLGIDPTLASGQLLDMVQGRASMNDTLFQRVSNETAAMKPFGGSSQKFNALEPAKRLQVLTKALAQFSSNVDVVKANAMSLSGEMRRLGEAIKGPFSILRPLGDVLLKYLLPIFHQVNDYLRREGAQVVKQISSVVEGIIKNPVKAIVNLMQIKKASEDLRQAGHIMKFAGEMQFLGWILSKLTGIARLANPILGIVSAALGTITVGMMEANPYLGAILKWVGIIFAVIAAGARFPIVFTAIGLALQHILIPLGIIWGALQLFSRAAAIAKIADAKALAAMLPEISLALNKFTTAFGFLWDAFMVAFDGVAEFISPLFRVSYYVGALVDIITLLADTTVKTIAGFQGLYFAITQGITNMINYVRSKFGLDSIAPSAGLGDAFNAGVDDILEKYFSKIGEGKGIVQQNVNVNGGVHINNSFKENMEPDRIAFSLKSQFLKAANNRTQARGRSLSTSNAGAF